MIPLGPEALMVESKIDARVELAEFLRLEYAGADARPLAARMQREAEAQRVDVPSRRPLLSRARRWLRGDEGRLAARLRVEPVTVRGRERSSAEARAPSAATLAALPAAQAGIRPEGRAAPLSAVPLLIRG